MNNNGIYVNHGIYPIHIYIYLHIMRYHGIYYDIHNGIYTKWLKRSFIIKGVFRIIPHVQWFSEKASWISTTAGCRTAAHGVTSSLQCSAAMASRAVQCCLEVQLARLKNLRWIPSKIRMGRCDVSESPVDGQHPPQKKTSFTLVHSYSKFATGWLVFFQSMVGPQNFSIPQ